MKTDTTTKVLLGAVLAILVIILVALLATERKNVEPVIIDQVPLNQQGTAQPSTPAQPQASSQPAASQSQGNSNPNQAHGVTTSYSGTFTGPNGEYSFKLPSGWNAIQAPQSTAVLFGANTTTENADGSMVVYRNQPSAAAVMQFLSSNFGVTFSGQSSRTINGASAISATIEGEGGVKGPFTIIYKNGTAYGFSLTKDEPAMFEALVSTFKVN